MARISVIVPVYKVEEYLDKCVQSIVDQTYTNLEIILVDDGSPDRCGEMCDEWAKKDARIRVVHKENGGLSDARNAGMAVATGEYIGFVDSDDWIEPQMYQCLYEAMVATDSDVASCGALRVWADGRPAQKLVSVNRDCVLEREEAMEALITLNGLVQTVWDKLYRKDVAEKVLFPVGLIHEDEFWTWQVIAAARRVVTLKEFYYNYLQRSDSIMGARYLTKGLLAVQAKKERQEYIENAFPALTNISRMDLHYTCLYQGMPLLKILFSKGTMQHMKYLKNTIREYPIAKEYLHTLTKKKRFRLKMLRTFFVLTCLLQSIRE